MENPQKQQKIADAYQQHLADNRQRLMPDEPRLYLMLHPLFQKMAIEGTTPERHRPKKKRHQQFAPPIMTEPERLQQIEYQKDNLSASACFAQTDISGLGTTSVVNGFAGTKIVQNSD